jgi:hypothetical protein
METVALAVDSEVMVEAITSEPEELEGAGLGRDAAVEKVEGLSVVDTTWLVGVVLGLTTVVTFALLLEFESSRLVVGRMELGVVVEVLELDSVLEAVVIVGSLPVDTPEDGVLDATDGAMLDAELVIFSEAALADTALESEGLGREEIDGVSTADDVVGSGTVPTDCATELDGTCADIVDILGLSDGDGEAEGLDEAGKSDIAWLPEDTKTEEIVEVELLSVDNDRKEMLELPPDRPMVVLGSGDVKGVDAGDAGEALSGLGGMAEVELGNDNGSVG